MASNDDYSYDLNRVYLPVFGWSHSEDKEEFAFDLVTSFEFLLEALIAHSASEIVISSRHKDFVKLLRSVGFPEPLLKRIKFVDTGKVKQEAQNITSPAFEEFSVREVTLDNGTITWQGLDDQIKDAVLAVDNSLYHLLLGLRYKLQVDIRIHGLERALLIIRQRSKYAETRATMSIIQGIFSCYKGSKLNTLSIASSKRKQLLNQFLEFVEDASFREYSNANFCLGFPHLLRKAVSRVNQATRKIASSEKFGSLLSISSKVVTAAYQIPPVDAQKVVKALVVSPYLPPSVDLRPIYDKSEKLWMNWKNEQCQE